MMTLAELLMKAKEKRISVEFNSMLSVPDDCVAVRFRRDHLYIDVVIDTREKRIMNLISRHVDEFAARCGYLERGRKENGKC